MCPNINEKNSFGFSLAASHYNTVYAKTYICIDRLTVKLTVPFSV